MTFIVISFLAIVVLAMMAYAWKRARDISRDEMDAMDEACHSPDDEYYDDDKDRAYAIDRNEQDRINSMRGDG